MYNPHFRFPLSVSLVLTLCLAHSSFARAEVYEQGAVASDSPLASQVGASVLARGGNAVDAAVATALVLGVVNPFASGLGGGGFALIYDHDTRTTDGIDFRETAPLSVTMDDYSPNGEHDPELSRHGGLAVATPGELAGLFQMHERYGRLPWHTLVRPAQQIAQKGFPANELMVGRVAILKSRSGDQFDAIMADLYAFDGPLQVGTIVKRPKLARALELLERNPIKRFYQGQIAADIASTVQANNGKLTQHDMESYKVVWRKPHRFDFQDLTIDVFPLPSSGSVVFDLAFRGYEALQKSAGEPASTSPFTDIHTFHRFLHALTWGFAVRAEDLGDPDYSDIPIQDHVNDAAIERIVSTFNPDHRQPVEAFSLRDQVHDDDGTTHLSVVDAQGNSVALTSTVNTIYGSFVVSERYGILLNNEMDDFATAPNTPNAFGLIGFQANQVRPGARPLSSMSPTLVFKDERLLASMGGSGGPRIITATIETLIRLLDGASSKDAIESPRFHHQWIPETLELDDELQVQFGRDLKTMRYSLAPVRWRGAVQAIWRTPQGWDAASDASKEGAPAGTRFSSRENTVRVLQQHPTP